MTTEEILAACEPDISLWLAAYYDLPQCEQFYVSNSPHGECPEPATVNHLETGLYLCNRHFRMFEREYEV